MNNFYLFLNVHIGMKYGIVNESSLILWHRRLSHISKEKITRLIKKGILSNINFSDFDMCIDCIEEK